MPRLLILVALAILVISLDRAPLAAQKAVPAKLDGTWKGFVVNGKGENPNDGPLHLQLEVQGNKMTATDLRAKKGLGEGTFKLDAARKELDATGNVMGAGKSRTYLGIYELDGDTLKWCVTNNGGKTRPPDLSTNTRNQSYYLILKRQKS